jgi:hypothetical protein
MSVDEFRSWFVPISWNIEQSNEPRAIELVYHVDGVLAEASSEAWTEEQLHEELAGPFVADPSAQEIVGDPSPFQISQYAAPSVTNTAVAA